LPEETEGAPVEMNAGSLAEDLQLFLQHIDALQASLPRTMVAVNAEAGNARARFLGYAEKHGTVTKRHEQTVDYTFSVPYEARAMRLAREAASGGVAVDLVPRVFLLALISQFDAFLGRLLRGLFLLRPELIASSERSLTLSQLLDLGSVERATEFLLDKEVESVLRKSHADQFSWMEAKFDIKLREGLTSWPCFIEITERRNLFAHADGVISDQYLDICERHGAELGDGCAKGDRLGVTSDYFVTAYECILELGVKLCQVLWRKLRPDQIDDADDNLNAVTFDLLVGEKYELACQLLDFACTVLRKHGSERSRLILTVNRAQAHKWSGDDEKCARLLGEQDWSAAGTDFRLAVAVLGDRFDEAADIMKSIGPDESMPETNYQEWPVFREFRKSQQFADAFEAVFGKAFVSIETTVRDDERERQQAALDQLREMLKDATITDDPDDAEDDAANRADGADDRATAGGT